MACVSHLLLLCFSTLATTINAMNTEQTNNNKTSEQKYLITTKPLIQVI